MEREIFTAETAGERIDALLPRLVPELTRSAAQRLLDSGGVTVNGVPARKNLRVSAGDEICVTLPEPESVELLPQDLPLDVVYEDGDLIVVN